ncbi:hypothetical protein ASPACDRAFT_43853 [Aspergillus aculeatus ATCC 16872]|uniref:Uncharacterized protein n=1 Tax=Aspergillus aculeatus (strain ATCC 16872 / CBS 172.66 / WB 5094) TaxID=690307 RepID=A0A1L9WST3_ASPA1|nr:uncharacterized protein ASPACDRAFT_43853 [Aspergillus aculeatus ATCC 16872]OJJ99188.1 hypothetical protein ASPACDRAFT_43853 [Aspergillus aculeatus ATCC 16872]
MKATVIAALATFATLVAATPISPQARAMTVNMHRKSFSQMLQKREGYDGNIIDSVNYILVILTDEAGVADPYQDEVDAVSDPSDSMVAIRGEWWRAFLTANLSLFVTYSDTVTILLGFNVASMFLSYGAAVLDRALVGGEV